MKVAASPPPDPGERSAPRAAEEPAGAPAPAEGLRVPKWLLEEPMRTLVAWLESISLFKALEYVGRLAILLAIVSFFAELPQRYREAQYVAWQTIEAASGKVYSRARVSALERLGGDCVSLEGLVAERADLRGLALDRCYGVPGGSLIGSLAPQVFRRRGALLRGADLTGADLRQARLPAADLSRAKLAGALLTRAELAGARLAGADLAGADLFRADLRDADLSGADLSGADLSHADLAGARLRNARMRRSRLLWTDLAGADLEYAELGGANLSRARFPRADLFKAVLAGGLLRRARLDERTELDGADLAGADLRGAALASADQVRSARNWKRALLDPGWQALGGAAAPPRRPPLLGLVINDAQFFFREIHEGVRRVTEAAGARLVVREVAAVAGTAVGREEEIVRELERLGVDAVLVVPQDERRSVPVLRRAYERGIAVVCYDHCIELGAASRFVVAGFESDQRQLGYSTGTLLARWLRKNRPRAAGPVAVGIAKFCDFEGCYRRAEGFRAALDESGVPWREAAKRNRSPLETPFEAAAALLSQHPEVSVVWSANEDGTESVVEAVRALGLAGRVRVWGTDISPQLQAMLRAPDQVLQAVTGQRPREIGARAAQAALAALRDRPSPYGIEIIPHQPYERKD